MSKRETQGFDISKKSAAVIGCGGLGCNVSVHLAGAGAGTLFVCDYDTAAEDNLNRQFVYTSSDIGESKAAVMSEFLRNYAPDGKIIPISKKIECGDDLSFAKECDIIILAVDNNETRKLANEFCRENDIPLVSGGISGFYGNGYLYIPGKTPCLECAGLLTENYCGGNVSSTAGVIGALSAELAIKYLTGDYSPAGRLFVYDDCEMQSLKIKASCECGCLREENDNG